MWFQVFYGNTLKDMRKKMNKHKKKSSQTLQLAFKKKKEKWHGSS